MLKKLLKLIRSDERVVQALNQTGVSYSLSPDMPLIPANDTAQVKVPVEAGTDQKPKMWLDGWNERDESRLKQPLHWEGYID